MSEIDEFKKILKSHEKRITALEKTVHGKSKNIPLGDESLLDTMIKNGFFDTPKKLSDITKELKTKAKYNKNTKYTSILKKLTRDDKLKRIQVKHQWEYEKND